MPERDPDRSQQEQAPVQEAGGGESEGFEQAEQELIEHASHGDQHAARRVLEDSPDRSEDARASDRGGEADVERSDEREA